MPETVSAVGDYRVVQRPRAELVSALHSRTFHASLIKIQQQRLLFCTTSSFVLSYPWVVLFAGGGRVREAASGGGPKAAGRCRLGVAGAV